MNWYQLLLVNYLRFIVSQYNLKDFVVDKMLSKLDILNTSTLLMSWARAMHRDEEQFGRVVDEIVEKHELKIFYEKGCH